MLIMLNFKGVAQQSQLLFSSRGLNIFCQVTSQIYLYNAFHNSHCFNAALQKIMMFHACIFKEG